MTQKNDLTVGAVLKTSSSYWHACTLHTGVGLEVFSNLQSEQLTAKEVAEKINGNERAVETLLNALVAMELLEKNGALFKNTEFSRKHLVKESSDYIGHIILHHRHLVDGWNQLDKAVQTGQPVEKRSYGEDVERESFLMGMFNMAMSIAPTIAKQISLEGRKHLLDLGGGPGTHAIYFCLENGNMKATIYDRATTRDFAADTVKRFGLAERIDFLAGDFNDDSLGGPYDVAWLSQILHSNGPEECKRLIAKTVAALEKGGLILVHEFFLEENRTCPLFPALFSLNMLINNGHGQSYTEGDVREMFLDAGVKDIERLPFQGPNDSYVLCGTV